GAIGAAFGLASWFALQVFGFRPTRGRVALLTLAIGVAAAAQAVARRPAIFEYLLWRRGGWRAALEVALTEKIGVTAIDWILAAFATTVGLTAVIRYRRHWRRPSVIAAAALAAIMLLAPRLFHHRWRGTRPAVVLLVADSLRPDHLS